MAKDFQEQAPYIIDTFAAENMFFLEAHVKLHTLCEKVITD